MERETREALLQALMDEVRGCTRCPLHRTRNQAVPGEGPLDAPIIFVGEGPGAQEDKQGRPFVGPSGHLLEQLLEEIGLTRDDTFITNVVKCRPPNNRDPEPDEIEACKPYLARQLRLVDPALIVTLGRFAMERWLPHARISRVHGTPHRFGKRLIVPMFHPAAALRNSQWEVALHADFAQLPELIDFVRFGEDLPTVESVAPDPTPPPPAQPQLF